MLWTLLLGMACSGQVVDTADDSPGACGVPSEHDVTLRVSVQSTDGEALRDIEVVLEDRAWTLSDLGSASTDESGEAVFGAQGVTDLPNCWGTMLDYVLVATDPLGRWAEGEKELNSSLYNAISEGTLEADVRGFPIVLEEVVGR